MDNDEEIFSLLGFVKSSISRKKTMKALGDNLKTPTELGKDTDMRTTQVSNALGQLKKKNLVVCLNEQDYKGRIYTCTDLGKEVLELLN